MALSDADRDWLTDQFKTVHERVNEETAARVEEAKEIVSSVYRLKSEVQTGVYTSASAIANALTEHKEQAHNPAKTLGYIGLLVGIGGGIMEGIKFLFHIGKDSR